MELLASLFVGNPQSILVVAMVFLVAYLVLRFMVPGKPQQSRLLLIASIAWGLYAAWEWLVLINTPEANIRVDLMVLWPVLAIISAWALYRVIR